MTSIIKMENYEICKLLNDSTESKFVTKNDLSNGQYSVTKSIRFKNSMLRSNLYDYSEAYIVVKGKITIEEDNDYKTRNKKLVFKNNAPLRSCI